MLHFNHWIFAPVKALLSTQNALSSLPLKKLLMDGEKDRKGVWSANTLSLPVPTAGSSDQQNRRLLLPHCVLNDPASLSVKKAKVHFSTELKRTEKKQSSLQLTSELVTSPGRRRASRKAATINCAAVLALKNTPIGVSRIGDKLTKALDSDRKAP